MRTPAAAIVFVIGLAAIPVASAQNAVSSPGSTPVTLTEFVLKDGSRMHGTIESETPDEIVFRTPAGAVVNVRRADLLRTKPLSGRMEEGQFFPDDPHVTRLFFAPTGRSLPPGRVSFGLYGLMPFVQVGVTERFSVGGGTPLFFGFGESNRPFWVTPKMQLLRTGTTQVAAGVFHVFNAADDGAGIAYAVGTRGHSDNALTGGVGYAYAGDGGGMVVMVGGERRARSNLKFMTENYLWKGGQGVLSGGVRFVGERFATDVMLVAPLGFDLVGVFPAVSVVYVF